MNTLKEKYSSYSNEQLLDMLAHREDYKEEAIKTVEELLVDRKVDEGEIQGFLEIADVFKQEKKKIENEPLGIGTKILLLIFPFIVMTGLLKGQLYYHERGYEQKKADVPVYTLLGIVLWMVVIYMVNA